MTSLSTAGPSSLRATARALLRKDAGPWISAYMPVRRPWNEMPTNRAQLRRVREEARSQAAVAPLSESDLEPLVESAQALEDTPEFWDEDFSGLALFLSPDTRLALRLPFAPAATTVVDRLVHVRPLWRHLSPDETFFVLGLSAGGAELFRASRHHIETVPLEEGPTTLDDVLQFDEHISSLRYHTKTSPGSAKGGRRSAIFYGHEDAGDHRYVKEGILRFFRALDNAVREVVEAVRPPPPLVLAGIEQLRGLYRQVNQYAHLLEAAVETSVIAPESRTWDADALHEEAWSVVRPRLEQALADARTRFHARPAHTAANPGAALLAAVGGRVDTLFVAEVPEAWGVLHEARHSLALHERRLDGDIEFLNAAAVRTLRADGTVYVTETDEVPGDGSVAALLRY